LFARSHRSTILVNLQARHAVDIIGFAFATGLLVAVYAVFGVIGRLLDIVSAGVRATVAPPMLSGFRAWTGPIDGAGDEPDDAPSDGGDLDGDDADLQSIEERRWDPGLVVPVTPLAPRGRQRFALA
jgi:hypothetical protein